MDKIIVEKSVFLALYDEEVYEVDLIEGTTRKVASKPPKIIEHEGSTYQLIPNVEPTEGQYVVYPDAIEFMEANGTKSMTPYLVVAEGAYLDGHGDILNISGWGDCNTWYTYRRLHAGEARFNVGQVVILSAVDYAIVQESEYRNSTMMYKVRLGRSVESLWVPERDIQEADEADVEELTFY